MTKELVMVKAMSNKEIRELVGKAICEKVEFTPGDFVPIDGKTVAIAEHTIQLNFLLKNGFKG